MKCVTTVALFATTALLLTLKTTGFGQAPVAKKYALVVGVNKYQHDKLPDLPYAVNDARELATVLRKSGYQVVLLTDDTGKNDSQKAPTRANIEHELKKILDACRPKKRDMVLIAFAGHGLQIDEEPFFCPQEAVPFSDRKETMVSLQRLYGELERSFAGPKLVLVDACRNAPGRSIDPKKAAPPERAAAFFSCASGGRAYEDEKLQHGLFFYFVLKALRGEAADAKNNKGEVTFSTLVDYVSGEVPKKARELKLPEQLPNQQTNLVGPSPVLIVTADRPPTPMPMPVPATEPAKFVESNFTGMKLVYIPPGKFVMGSPNQEWGRRNDETQHEVEITKGFYMGVYTVTQEEYEKVMETNPSYFSANGGGKDKVAGLDTRRFPVECVSWDAAKEFCRKLSQKDGKTYRLPTEAEWEYACRAGTTTPFHFGQTISPQLANYDARALLKKKIAIKVTTSPKKVMTTTAKKVIAPPIPADQSIPGIYRAKPMEVGSFPKNDFGLYDMHGNVVQWCEDWYDSAYYNNSPKRDPLNTTFGKTRVFRGSSWGHQSVACRAANRNSAPPVNRYIDLGLRVVLSVR